MKSLLRILSDTFDIAYKECLHIQRDRTTLVIALVIPLVQMALFGFAINFDVRHIATVVVDLDHSRDSRDYVQSLKNTENLEIVGYLDSPEQAALAIRRNQARVAVIIPPDFGRRSGTQEKPAVSVLIDGSDSQVANPARSAVLRPSPGDFDVRLDMLFNPDNKTEIYTIPGLLGIILQLITVTLTAFSIVRERDLGTLEQLMVTPVGRFGLMLGKVLPYFVLAMAELVAVVIFGHLVFHVPMAGSFPLLILLSVPFVLAGLSMGLLISAVAKNQGHAMQLAQLTFLPAILLSGYLAPRETLPSVLYWLSDMFPVTFYIQITRGVMVRGAGFMDLLPQVLALCFMSVVLLYLSIARFRKSIS